MNDLLKKFTQNEILQTGLFYKNEKNNKFVNRFHSRIIFPIKNIVGDVIAFGGRITENKKIGKIYKFSRNRVLQKRKTYFQFDKKLN